jgi:multidrug efflux pump subunit AcrB
VAVTARPDRLAQYGLTAADLFGALQARGAVADGGEVDAGAAALRVRAAGPFRADDEVAALRVATARGAPVRLGDVAAVDRRYADPTYAARVDGAPAVLMSVEMQEGRNIVAYGRDLDRALAAVRPLLPPDLRIDRVADQPTQVRHRVLDFGREFAIAVVAVILVTVLLLPLRVAAIAALAIPATVAVTVAALHALGIALHQISFAGLVVALGMVVDDAIVIADNYVELLDEGVARPEAAWRSASDLAGPVLGATLTIVASFLPLGLLLPGTVGEFIRALPFTVAVALLCSFGVAMFLTPLLCLAFIKTGLRPHAAAGEAAPARRRRTPLDVMQAAYERAMAWAMPRPRLTLALAALSVAAGAALLGTRPQRFFPPAERPQFVVDVWMPEGTRFAATDSTVARLAAALRRTPGVAQVGAFVGGSAPRFYYNVEPEFNVPNFGQLVVNTRDMHATPALQASLHAPLARLAPEATVLVRQLEQGPALKAPIEVRLAGEDPATLRALADRAARVLEAAPGSEYVRTDWREDQPGLALALRRETAARLGLTEADVARQLGLGFDGAPASTFWEGARRVDVRLRFDSASRAGPADVGDAYVTAPATGARVPLRAVADVRAEWAPSRIVRRNGVRTVSVLAYAQPGVLASTVLAAARPGLEAIALPAGYRLAYGGEVENQGEVQGPMAVALSVSLLAIFLILVLQFRTVRHPLVIMVSIPLALFGSALGLVLTRNPFGFTANLGLTALTGVVVRNAIILVDYALARRRAGEGLVEAALDAGRRRLRPIFLTTMAAAVGVVPLIASGSGLWSPLASVLAVGLVCSMVGTLVVVPILFVLAEARAERRVAHASRDATGDATLPAPAGGLGGLSLGGAAGAALLALVLSAVPRGAVAQPSAPDASVVRLTLDEAVARAVGGSRAARIAGARADERRALARGARAGYLPQLAATGQLLGRTGTQRIDVPQGALGGDASGRPLPFSDRTLEAPGGRAYVGLVTLAQPVTQLAAVRAGARAAAAGRARRRGGARGHAARRRARRGAAVHGRTRRRAPAGRSAGGARRTRARRGRRRPRDGRWLRARRGAHRRPGRRARGPPRARRGRERRARRTGAARRAARSPRRRAARADRAGVAPAPHAAGHRRAGTGAPRGDAHRRTRGVRARTARRRERRGRWTTRRRARRARHRFAAGARRGGGAGPMRRCGPRGRSPSRRPAASTLRGPRTSRSSPCSRSTRGRRSCASCRATSSPAACGCRGPPSSSAVARRTSRRRRRGVWPRRRTRGASRRRWRRRCAAPTAPRCAPSGSRTPPPRRGTRGATRRR